MKKPLYRLEFFSIEENDWVPVKKDYRNQEHAIFNGEVMSRSRKCICRVVHTGETLWQSEEAK